MRILQSMKKFMVLLLAGIVLSFVNVSNSHADSESYLYNIMIYTNGILKQVNNLPNYLEGLGKFIISWMTPDDSDSTAQMQTNFASMGSLITQNAATQNNAQLTLTADLYGVQPSSFNNPPNSPEILKKLPQINDITYATMLGLPPSPKAPKVANAPYNYIKNAGGLTTPHTIPDLKWQGPVEDQDRYMSFYNTMMAIESFNGYVLSNQYAEAMNENAFTSLQNSLITQATNSTWIGAIATEELGKVFRQILLFQSQTYVLVTQLLQTEKQLLAAQAMTNSLLILNNQNTESLLVSRAQGLKPQP